MIHNEITGIAYRHINSLDVDFGKIDRKYTSANTLKSLILTGICEIKPQNTIEVTVSDSEYMESLLSELYFGNIRIREQIKSIGLLTTTQPAWLLVTVYYACYFLVTDLSKASGRHILNFSDDDLNHLLSNATTTVEHTITVQSNNSFFVKVTQGEYLGEVKLSLKYGGGKPHHIAWQNFRDTLSGIKVNDTRTNFLVLLKNILASEKNWQTPSAIRNTWNYSTTTLFGSHGTSVAKTFSSIISSADSTYSWANKNTLKANDENLAASVAFIYFLLEKSHFDLINRLQLQ